MKTKRNNKKRNNITKKIKISSLLPSEKKDSLLNPLNNHLKFFSSKDLESTKKLKEIYKDATNPLLKNDYYNYVDKIWKKNVQIPKEEKYIVELDNFRLVQYKVYEELNDIIKNIITTRNNKESSYIKKFYNSYLHLIDSKTCMKYAKEELEIIDNFRKDENNLWKLLAYMNRNEVYSGLCPLNWRVSQDLKDSNKMECYISSTVFSLPHPEIYIDDGTKVEFKKKVRRRFKHYLNNVFECCFGKNHSFNVNDIFDIEVQLMNTFVCPGIKESSSGYNRVFKEEAFKKYNFDWNQFSKNIGFSKTPNFFIVLNLSYFKCTTEILLKEWNSEKWRTYWIYIYIKKLSRFSVVGRGYYEDFYAKLMKGVELINKTLASTILTTYAFNNLITTEYVKKYKIHENILYTKNLANDLKQIFTKIIRNCKWLQPKTKEYALLKLKHFKFYIGETEKLLPDPLLNYKDNDIWYNLNLLSEYRLKMFIHLNGKKPENIPIINWKSTPFSFTNLQPYVVNASYSPTKNAITIPLAYIQKPFLELNTPHSFSYNLANIGFTIGHEMSHSLDDLGSQYDYKGNLNDWWTPEDKKKYKIIQKNIINQYEEWAKRDGVIYDATKTIGEDLADISGITTVIEYFTEYLSDMVEFPSIIDISLKSFFLFFAYQMRQLETKQGFIYELLGNVHPPNNYRTNIPLSRTPAFKLIYNITEKDDMYWKSTNRVWLE